MALSWQWLWLAGPQGAARKPLLMPTPVAGTCFLHAHKQASPPPCACLRVPRPQLPHSGSCGKDPGRPCSPCPWGEGRGAWECSLTTCPEQDVSTMVLRAPGSTALGGPMLHAHGPSWPFLTLPSPLCAREKGNPGPLCPGLAFLLAEPGPIFLLGPHCGVQGTDHTPVLLLAVHSGPWDSCLGSQEGGAQISRRQQGASCHCCLTVARRGPAARRAGPL